MNQTPVELETQNKAEWNFNHLGRFLWPFQMAILKKFFKALRNMCLTKTSQKNIVKEQ